MIERNIKDKRNEDPPINTNFGEHTKIIGQPTIGEGTWIGHFTVIDGSGGLEIGENCDISCGVHIYTHSTVKRCVANKKFNPDGTVNRELIEKQPTKIGNHTFIGANATILMGTTIGNHCIIGAGSVITKDVPDFNVVAGVPAKKIGQVIIENNQARINLIKQND